MVQHHEAVSEGLRAALNPGSQTPYRYLLREGIKRCVDLIVLFYFIFTTAPKVWILLYSSHYVLWIVGLGYIIGKISDLLLNFEMPWWFEVIDVLTAIITLPSKTLEVCFNCLVNRG